MKRNSGNVLVLVLTVFALGSLAAASGYFYLQAKSQNIPSSNQKLPPKTESFSCSTDSDCTMGIQTNKCCSCPQAIGSKLVGKDNWEIYVKGKNYAPNTEECHRVDCSPCEPLSFNAPICSAGKCIQGTNLPVETEKFCGGFAGKSCAVGYKCQLDGNYPDAGGKCVKN